MLKKLGAGARTTLIEALLKHGISASECSTSSGKVTATVNLSYGELAEKAATMKAPKENTLQLKAPKDFKLLG